MNRAVLTAFAMVAFVACDTSPTQPDLGSIVGIWSGTTTTGTIVEVSVRSQDGAGIVSGCVAFGYDPTFRPLDRVIVAIVGAFDGVTLTLATRSDQGVAWTYSGTRTGADSITSAAGILIRTSPAPAC